MHPLWTVAVVALAATVSTAPTPSVAADVPSGPRTKAILKLGDKYTTGVVDFPNDQDWYKVALSKGINYAFQVNLVTFERSFMLDLLDGNGRTLRAASSHGDGED